MRLLGDVSVFEKQKVASLYKAPETWIQGSGKADVSDVLALPEELTEHETLSCRYLTRSRVWNYFFQRRKNSHFYSMEYIYEGEFMIRSGNSAYIAEAGDLCILHPHRDNDLLYFPGKNCRKAGIIPVGLLLPELIHQLRLDNVLTVRVEQTLWDDLFDRLRDALRCFHDPCSRRRLSGVVFELLNLLAELHRADPVPAEIDAVRSRLERNFLEPFRMEALAAELGVSLPTFNVRFRESFGETPYQYLIRMRLLHAAKLLAGSRLTIKEISQLCGYGNPFHFSTEFSRFHGCPPREFRRRSVNQRSRSSAE